MAAAVLMLATSRSIQPLPASLDSHGIGQKQVYLDRHGRRLNITYQNQWNRHDLVRLHEVPELLVDAILRAEDKRFFEHGGVDWLARLNAARQNLLAGEVVRGASTISEQVVRMLHPRPRTLWSRWLEGLEAGALERRFSKLEILEFYLNQVPYRARRRGVVQAASYYFDRDVSTLNTKESLALAVLVRSPQWFDPERRSGNLDRAVTDLATRLDLSANELQEIRHQALNVGKPQEPADVSHFIAFAQHNAYLDASLYGRVNTTIDLELQIKVQAILNSRLEQLKGLNAGNGAVLVVDHLRNEIIAWTVGYAGIDGKTNNKIDAVLARRQPGSTLKPLLYAQALESGWTAATMLDDSPLQESVGPGLHTYRNYGREHYGLISLREALGNSLNIPAVRAVQYVGTGAFLTFLGDLGIESLSAHPNVYGDGLALGNGELSLFELVQAYTVLARMGDFKPLSALQGEYLQQRSYRVISEDVASLIADILSDPGAREKEFGWDSVLNFPQQTAVKTGTSSDYRDAWALGFNDRYSVGVWIGNLDYSAMTGITGSSGPALVLRSVFNELNRFREARPLYLSENLSLLRICIETGLPADADCEARDEWFVDGNQPGERTEMAFEIRLRKPSKGLRLAMDPRIPDDHEFFEFALTERADIANVRWYVNNRLVATTDTPRFNWKVSRGEFKARAEVLLAGQNRMLATETIEFMVN